MGEVYLAKDTKLERMVALKILPTELAANHDRMRRFIQEAKSAAGLSHPNIAQIFEIGECEGTHYIAMEFIDGSTLRQKIHRQRTDLGKLLRYLQHVAEGLAKAHAAGIIHRDLKPDNIMITREEHAKILDFGLAKLVEPQSGDRSEDASGEATAILEQHSKPGMIMGTVGYMSPEQARGKIKEIDHRSDIFSFGCILYEAVTGNKAFQGNDTIETLNKIIREPVTPITDYRPDAPNHLQRIVRRCLAKDPEDRYQTIKDVAIELRELRRDLADYAAADITVVPLSSTGSTLGSPINTASVSSSATQPTPSSSAEYIVTGMKRHKLTVGLVAIVLAVGIAALIYYLRSRSAEVPIDSIAVLPFVNATGDPNMEYLSDGITESIINSLSQLPNLGVIARSSVFRYKGRDTEAQTIGNELKVRAVLTGRVVQRGDNLAISVELVDTSNNHQLWGQNYNRKVTDVFAVQEEIANQITERLRLKPSGSGRLQLARRPTENLKAFQYYMQGRMYINRRTREDLNQAIHYCEKAIEEDKNYGLAYAGLADAYGALAGRGYIVPIDGQRKAQEMALKALSLDEGLAEAHASLGFVQSTFTPYNFVAADRELRRAIELSPSLAMAHYYLGHSLVRQGRIDEGSVELIRARELDPLSSTNARSVAIPHYLKRDNVRALELLQQANDLGPMFSTTWEVGVYVESRSFDRTLVELEKAKQTRKNDSILNYSTGLVYAAQGKRTEALQVIKELEEMSGRTLDQAHWIAKIYAALNERELALTWLERGLAAGAIANFYKDEPLWDSIRSDPRFIELLRQMGIPQSR